MILLLKRIVSIFFSLSVFFCFISRYELQLFPIWVMFEKINQFEKKRKKR